jgi:pyridoxal 5'-phosphate synthase pdxS subunit
MDEDEVFVYAKEIQAPYALVLKTKELGRLPVVNFAAGGVATPADAALMMQVIFFPCALRWLLFDSVCKKNPF